MLKQIAAVAILVAAIGQAQSSNPRFAKWKLKSDAPAPSSNVMTYEPDGTGGMKVTIDAVNKDGVKSEWGYTTMFDGKDRPVTGNPGTDTGSVKVITPQINEIVYKKAGKVSQILTNVLSMDGETIGVMYMRYDASGKVSNITVATYERMK